MQEFCIAEIAEPLFPKPKKPSRRSLGFRPVLSALGGSILLAIAALTPTSTMEAIAPSTPSINPDHYLPNFPHFLDPLTSVERSTVRITTSNSDGTSASCNGVIIRDQEIKIGAAGHCVQNANGELRPSPWIYSGNVEFQPSASRSSYTYELDLGVFEFDQSIATLAHLSPAEIAPLSSIHRSSILRSFARLPGHLPIHQQIIVIDLPTPQDPFIIFGVWKENEMFGGFSGSGLFLTDSELSEPQVVALVTNADPTLSDNQKTYLSDHGFDPLEFSRLGRAYPAQYLPLR